MSSKKIKLIPQPQKVELLSDSVINVKSLNLGENCLSSEAINDFVLFLKSVGISVGDGAAVEFVNDASLGKEEYRIEINDKIVITASAMAGELYALQTLKQILFQTEGNVPHLIIYDKPAKSIRGFMLDSGRYFFTVDEVKLFIRRMALHKLNLFHFHLTEDQGWRIEIEKYPLLTEVGSKRKKTNFNHKPHGGFYTKNDIREIVRYAHAFGISVMPEFDIPGHSRAAIACYKYLSCFERALPVADHWGVKHDVLCAGKETTYKFVEEVIDELCELFEDEYFHIGGDEVPKHRWKLCPHCQAKMKELGLKSEDELQCYFMNRIKNYCRKKGKQVFMWSWDLKDSSFLDDDLGFTKCSEFDTQSRPFIDTDTSAYYIDLPYGYISLKDSARHKLLSGNCLGAEAALWTEYVPNVKKADKMTYPRLSALSETVWNGKCSWEGLSEKLDFYYKFLDKNNISYTRINSANPGKLLGFIQRLYFEKRRLTWQGLTNIFDDKKVENIAHKNKK